MATVGIATAATIGAVIAYLATLPPPEVRLAGFATRLEGRSRAQRHNAELAARTLNGAVIPAGGAFSFNSRVRGWAVDQGFVKAPVSFDGELVPAFGGGVCQTSTTFYNAALLAGLTINERHHHVFAPQYVARGRDAAVAYPNLDLRVQNPYPYPVRIQAKAAGSQLTVEVWGKRPPAESYRLTSRVLSQDTPDPIRRRVPRRSSATPPVIHASGATGFRVVTYREVTKPGSPTRRQRLSDDSYPAMPAITRFADQ